MFGIRYYLEVKYICKVESGKSGVDKKGNIKRMKPLGRVKIEWSPNFAYAVGLLTTDGNLSSNGRQFDFTSKDQAQVENLKMCLGIKNKIGQKISGSSGKKCFRVQFGDILFYRFLISLGLMPNKSKIIGRVVIPKKFLFDFLRGHLDGDGSFHSYFDPRWKSSYMFYTIFMSASKTHVDWLRETIWGALKIYGHISKSITDSTYKLKYAKAESLKLLPKLYYDNQAVCLLRKRVKITAALKVNRQAA